MLVFTANGCIDHLFAADGIVPVGISSTHLSR